jgi:pantothenate kinase
VLLTPTEQISKLISTLKQREAVSGERQMVGIIGAPGTGKTTFAEYLVEQLPPQSSVIVPMDGFHLANVILDGTALQNRKGAIDTFDAYGYVSLLDRIRRADGDVVYAPTYRRGLEEPIAASIAVLPTARFVITEGNYLLSPDKPWNRIPDILDETWFVEVNQQTRVERLIARHEKFGMSHAAAVVWANSTDETNARYVERTKSRADISVAWW